MIDDDSSEGDDQQLQGRRKDRGQSMAVLGQKVEKKSVEQSVRSTTIEETQRPWTIDGRVGVES